MPEQIDLAAPAQVVPGTTIYRVFHTELHQDIQWDSGTSALVRNPANAFVKISLVGQAGLKTEHEYRGQEADNLIIALNKVDLSVKSLNRRILERLVADGKLAGTVSGTVD